MDKIKQVEIWLRELTYPAEFENVVQILDRIEEKNSKMLRACFYTDNHVYYIRAHSGNGKDYLGCVVNRRKPRAGEDWTRGNDLPDGKITKETWDRILSGIVKYELVKLSKYKKSVPDTEEVLDGNGIGKG